MTGTSNPPQEAPQNWGVFVPGFTVLILKGKQQQQHSSWINTATERKRRSHKRRIKISPNFWYCGCVSDSHLPAPLGWQNQRYQAWRVLDSGKNTRTPPSNSGTWWGKGWRKRGKDLQKTEVESSPPYKKLVPTTELQSYLLHIPFVPTLGNPLWINSACKDFPPQEHQ